MATRHFVTAELVEELERCEKYLLDTPDDLSTVIFMEEWNKRLGALVAVADKCAMAIWQQTRKVNGKETVMSVYSGVGRNSGLPKLDSTELKKFMPAPEYERYIERKEESQCKRSELGT